jgi:hypothetical protein
VPLNICCVLFLFLARAFSDQAASEQGLSSPKLAIRSHPDASAAQSHL